MFRRHSGQSVSEDDPWDDLRNRDSAAVKAALVVSCQVCEAGPGEDCQNLTNDFRLPGQRIVHFLRVPRFHQWRRPTPR